MALVADHFVAEFPLPMPTIELKFHLLHAGSQVGFQSGTVITLENNGKQKIIQVYDHIKLYGK